MTAATAPAPRVRVIAPGVSGDDLSAAGAPRNTPEPKRTGWPRGKKASKTRKPHKCKLCDQPGHNRLTCKKAKSKHAAPAAATRTRQLPALPASRAPQIGGGRSRPPSRRTPSPGPCSCFRSCPSRRAGICCSRSPRN